MLIIATMCSLLGGFAVLAADEYVKGDLLINGDFKMLVLEHNSCACKFNSVKSCIIVVRAVNLRV